MSLRYKADFSIVLECLSVLKQGLKHHLMLQ